MRPPPPLSLTLLLPSPLSLKASFPWLLLLPLPLSPLDYPIPTVTSEPEALRPPLPGRSSLGMGSRGISSSPSEHNITFIVKETLGVFLPCSARPPAVCAWLENRDFLLRCGRAREAACLPGLEQASVGSAQGHDSTSSLGGPILLASGWWGARSLSISSRRGSLGFCHLCPSPFDLKSLGLGFGRS